MKEEEANLKKCPKRIKIVAIPDGSTTDFDTCIGSDCMMWEPYNYWVVDGRYCSEDTEGAKPVVGGDCGLKSKDLECRL